ncbi:NUDIX domain-containing protein [Draconibacterium halophilum]|uniref:NUDIX domain-containing protein n=1 Tax=Draconibacterium halophilum TaxID=2706887 RepID=A0A6C0RAX1_9BACT|nr:NUDIX domain-containing protein [Draconibacterium halophilum]QIA07227.1 NUDIX domain-containing protein [Draconibacterium halophilum]
MGQFIIRVYGLVINKKNELLISDEFELNTKMTKFPGGGLEFGEGLINGLKREFEEECNGQQIENVKHFYTTDFYQKALFYDDAQLISIYYLADLKPPLKFIISEYAFDFKIDAGQTQSFRWAKIKDLKVDDITFPIDKFVLNKLKAIFNE